MSNELQVAEDMAHGDLLRPDSYDKADIVELIYRVEDLTGIEQDLADELMEIWRDDIFRCESCGKVFAWEDSVIIPGLVVDGKAFEPDDAVCKECRTKGA